VPTGRARSKVLPILAIVRSSSQGWLAPRLTPCSEFEALQAGCAVNSRKLRQLRLDFASVLEEARTLGAGFLVCPSVDAGERETADDWKRVCQTLNRMGRVVRTMALVLAYHNHDFEFVPFDDGTTPFHLMMTETDPRDVKLELDVYWVAKAGLDPVQYLTSGQDRILLVHLKTWQQTARRQNWVKASWTLNRSSARRFSPA